MNIYIYRRRCMHEHLNVGFVNGDVLLLLYGNAHTLFTYMDSLKNRSEIAALST